MTNEPGQGAGARTSPITVGGSVERRYAPVVETFRDNFKHRGEVGAALCIHVDGVPVVDVWAGERDPPSSAEPYDGTTLQLGFSTTKGVVATVVSLLIERDVLELDAPLSDYWPELYAASQGRVPLSSLLTHQLGLPALEAPFTLNELLDERAVIMALASQRPVWDPGTAHGYHAFTFGWLVAEVVRRAAGQTLRTLVRAELSEPLGLELYLGLAPELHHRVSPMRAARLPGSATAAPALPDWPLARAALAGPGGVFASGRTWNNPEVWSVPWASTNGFLTARSLSRLYAGLIGELDGIRLLAPETVESATKPWVRGPDRVLGIENRFGLGWQGSGPGHLLGSAEGFGHSGAGGSLGFADPAYHVAFGYTTNRARPGVTVDPRAQALIEALYRCL